MCIVMYRFGQEGLECVVMYNHGYESLKCVLSIV